MSTHQVESEHQAEITSDLLRKFRSLRQLSQAEAAQLLDVSRNYVSMLEQGQRQASTKLKRRLFQLLNEAAKEVNAPERSEVGDTAPENRLKQDPPPEAVPRPPRGLYRNTFPPNASPLEMSSASQAFISRLSEMEIFKSIDRTLRKLEGEPDNMSKLGYLATMRVCIEDLERRYSEKPA